MDEAATKNPLITVLLGDPRLPDQSKPGGRFTADDLQQVERLRGALAALPGYAFEFRDDHDRLLAQLQSDPPGFVLNFCDTGFRNDATLELHLPALLELLGIPFSGSGPVPLGLCYDKAFVRGVAESLGVPVPSEIVLAPGEPIRSVGYPAFIKPNRGDGSVGITGQSLVHDEVEARATVERLRAQLPEVTVLVQEFLSGTEYGVGLIGNPGHGFAMLPALEVDYSALDPALPRLLDYASKTDPESPYWRDVRFREADLSADVRDLLRVRCEALFQRLGLRDYARFDFRTDAAGNIKLMEINPNPAWCWDGKLAHMAGLVGKDQSWLIGAILHAAGQRTGLPFPAP